jgi:hypothetical protein
MKKFALTLTMLFGAMLFGQSDPGIHQGMVRFQGTLALGLSPAKLKSPEQRYYIYGELEYLFSDHWGFNGASFANLGSSEKAMLFGGDVVEDGYIHSILVGPVYHFFPDQAFDLHLGFQPGFSLTSMTFNSPSDAVIKESQISPTASPFLGVAYYGSFFHLFGEARWIQANYSSRLMQRSFSDLRLCIGLGFNFN